MPRTPTQPQHVGADATVALLETVTEHLRELPPGTPVDASGLAYTLNEDVEAVRVVLDFLAANQRVRPLRNVGGHRRGWSAQRFGMRLQG